MRQCVRVHVGTSVGFVTTDVRPPARCSVCQSAPHTRECDGPAPRRASGTCDAKLCDACRLVLPRGDGEEPLDLCPGCAGAPAAEERPPGRRRGLLHVELPQPWPWALAHAGAPCMFPRAEVAEGKIRQVPAPASLAGAWLALWAPAAYDSAAAEWMCSALGLEVPGPEALPMAAYVALAELSGCTTICNDGRCFTEPWWGGTGRTHGAYAWWVEACAVEPLRPAPGATPRSHLSLLPSEAVAELRRRYEATVSGRWWPPRYAPRVPPPPLHDDSPVPPMLEHPEQGSLL